MGDEAPKEDDIETPVRIGDVQRYVCKAWGKSREDMISDRRNDDIVIPRHIAMTLAKHLTGRSLPYIGRKFGGRDHTTVLHAIRKYEWLIDLLIAEGLTRNTPVAFWVQRAKFHFDNKRAR